ncbi:MAG: AzlD domain-containing protein [Rhodospirillales bacterium]|jgi:branched-subunit amino acid transport protein|nr:AzlD domain-containing protein [Rhodospirillales bacterium]
MTDYDLHLWLIILVSIISTYIWRLLGIVIASHLHPESALSRWFACVAYAVLAGLISRMIIMPVGALGEVLLLDKLVALGIGFGVFFLVKRNTSAGTAAAFLSFMAISLWRYMMHA